MRSCVPYFLLCCVVLNVVWSKPLQIEESDANESDETEYEVLNEVPASNLPDREENDISLGDGEVSADQEPEDHNQAESGENEYQSNTEQRYLRDIAETFSGGKRSERTYNNDLNEDGRYAIRGHTINYEDNNPQFHIRKEEQNKRTAELHATGAEDSMLFNRDEVSKMNNKYNNNEGLDTSEQAHFFKQYHNTMQRDNKRGVYDQSYKNEMFGEIRERREAEQTRDLPKDIDTQNEEIAIRKHVKKLSDTELKELLNSLTDEKRQLLKKIIDEPHANYDSYENINKREITKKAGALEENNLVENVQSELNKIQPSSSSVDENTESPDSTNVDSTTLNKQTESPDTGNTNSDSKIEMSTTSDLKQLKSDKLNSFTSRTDTKQQVSNVQETSKCENKREANYNNFLSGDISLVDTGLVENGLDNDNSPESTFDQEYICSQEEADKKVENQNGDYKREANLVTPDDLPDSLKSLAESFPNSNAYYNPASYSGALIRVKRKDINHNMKKRSAGLMPHAKTGYFQYRSESEEADNDEGNEFGDDGFYEVMSNLVKNKPIDNVACDNSATQQSATGTTLSDTPILPSNNNVESVNLGSDTDRVISGIEGVDDNLMYSSKSRNRRNDHIKLNEEQLSASHSAQLGDNEMKTASEMYMSAPNYQENDAFGPLPRKFDGDLGRYKRIRRLKPAQDSDEESSSDSTQ